MPLSSEKGVLGMVCVVCVRGVLGAAVRVFDGGELGAWWFGWCEVLRGDAWCCLGLCCDLGIGSEVSAYFNWTSKQFGNSLTMKEGIVQGCMDCKLLTSTSVSCAEACTSILLFFSLGL